MPPHFYERVYKWTHEPGSILIKETPFQRFHVSFLFSVIVQKYKISFTFLQSYQKHKNTFIYNISLHSII
jgi:hypothetical protein